MPSPKTSRPPPARQAPSTPAAARSLGTLAGMAVLGGVLGLLIGVTAGVLLARPGPILWLAGAVFGLTGGLAAGFWKTRASNGKPRLRPGEGLSNHILALQEALASAPRRVERIVAHSGGVTAIAVSPDGKSVLSGGVDRVVKLWDLATGFPLREFGDLASPVHAVAFSPDGRLAAACGMEDAGTKEVGVILVWDVES